MSRKDTIDAYKAHLPHLPPTSNGVPATARPKRTQLDASFSRMEAKDVIAAEHKVELCDTIQDCITNLKSLYRTKFIFGEYLKFVDSNHASDAYGAFNIPNPGAFDLNLARPGAANNASNFDTKSTAGAPGGSGSVADDALREKLRTAEELIKKLYKRNTHLEAELRYYKGEVVRLEKTQDLAKPVVQGQYTRSRSSVPTRELLHERFGGAGVRVLRKEDRADVDNEIMKKYGNDSGGTGALRARVTELTLALVKSQHENERLNKEKVDRVSTRDNLMRQYLAKRDETVAHLHGALQTMLHKINNPLKLSRVKQPSVSVSAAVAAGNILKNVNKLLMDETAKCTEEILTATHTIVDDVPVATRKRELYRRVRELSESLPMPKKKEMLIMMQELKALYEAMATSNRTLIETYQELKVRLDHEVITTKMQAAILRDQIKSLGLQEVLQSSPDKKASVRE